MPKYDQVTIYLLEDINDLQYVGSTAQLNIYQRLSTHRRDKKNGSNCSSGKLNLYNCSMVALETCENKTDIRREREGYWISQYPECVNTKRLNSNSNRLYKNFTEEQKKKKRASARKYYNKNREDIAVKKKIQYLHKKLSNL